MPPHVCILMGTFNGAQYLSAQLASFVAQTHGDWSLRISDDGSNDGTREAIKVFKDLQGDHDIRVYEGPRLGPAANFLSLLGRDDLPERAWVALSDQDDVWFADRISHALQIIGSDENGRQACVYASRTVLTDADLTVRGPSRRHPKAPTFCNALVQNVLAGNTMLLSPLAVKLLQRTAPAALRAGVAHHDWWIYLLLSGAGARIINDDRPGLYYRQHDDNHLGANRGFVKAWNRFSLIGDGHYGNWLRRNMTALGEVADVLTPENKDRAELFADWLTGSRLRGGLGRNGAWRQTFAGNLMLRMAAMTGRL